MLFLAIATDCKRSLPIANDRYQSQTIATNRKRSLPIANECKPNRYRKEIDIVIEIGTI